MKKRKSSGFTDGQLKGSKKKRTSLLPQGGGTPQDPSPTGKLGKQTSVPPSLALTPAQLKKFKNKKKNRNRGKPANRNQPERQKPQQPSVERDSDDSYEDVEDQIESKRTEPREVLKNVRESNGRTVVDGRTGVDGGEFGNEDSMSGDGDADDDVGNSNSGRIRESNSEGKTSRTNLQVDSDDESSDEETEGGNREVTDTKRNTESKDLESERKLSKQKQSDESGNDTDSEDENESGSREAGNDEDGEDNQVDKPSEEGKEDGAEDISHDAAQKVTNAILTKTTFSSLKDSVCEGTLRGVSDMGFTYMTEIQEKTLPPLLEGRDLLAAAKTGSGKTLAFLIPAIELIHKLKFMPRNGTGVIIISPTRELCMQIYGVLKEVMVHHYHTYGIVMGGTNRTTEMKKLEKGVNILVATPGRLLDHMQKTPQFLFKNLQCLVIDEADRILDIGFEEDMKQIVKLLPKKRQTMLFSATQTRKTEDLARISLKKQPIYIGVDDEKSVATVNGLEQGYVLCPSEKRFLLLFTFLKKNRSKKVMVFMSSCKSVKYHAELLNYIDLPVACIHGRKKQANRTTTFFQFCQAKQGILICTDVAARGLDIPAVDWIVQYDPPDDPKEYIHRVGRTARGLHGKGHALLILRPEEVGFLRYLKHAKVPINEYDFSWAKVANIQIQLEKLVEKNYFLHVSAKEAYKGYIRAYQSHSLKKIFRLESLDLNLVAKSFGFRVPPSVDLIVPTRKKSAGRDKGFNPRQHSYKKAQKSKIFRHVDSRRDRKDMRSAMTH